MVYVSVYKATDLFDIRPVTPDMRRGDTEHTSDIFNLTFRYNNQNSKLLAGGGIYAIFYQGGLLYIGIYTGNKWVPFAGNVAKERLWKHLESLTLRGRSVGFSGRNYDLVIKLAVIRPHCPLIQTLQKARMLRDNGSVKTYPSKVEFASDNWATFSCIESNFALNDFVFVYGRVDAQNFSPNISYQQVKNYLGVIENDLLSSLKPRCNERFNRSNDKYLVVGPARDAWASFADTVANQVSHLAPYKVLRT